MSRDRYHRTDSWHHKYTHPVNDDMAAFIAASNTLYFIVWVWCDMNDSSIVLTAQCLAV